MIRKKATLKEKLQKLGHHCEKLERENIELNKKLADLKEENYYNIEDLVSVNRKLGCVSDIDGDIISIKFLKSYGKPVTVDRTCKELVPVIQNVDAYW